MDERTAQIEHLISHYLHRDLFRVHARDYLRRNHYQRVTGMAIGSVTFYKTGPFDIVHRPGTAPEINGHVVHLTRESLKRVKVSTLDYLHGLLHDEPVLDEHEHVHSDGVIFTYVIQEAEF